MEKGRKVLSIVTIVSVVLLSMLLICLLFGLDLLGDLKTSVYFTLGSLTVGGFFAINSLNMVLKNKILGWVSFSLIAGSVFLIVLSSWISLNNSVFTNIMISLGLLSVLFNVIVSSGLDLGKNYLAVQIPIYIVTAIADLITSLLVFGVLDIMDMLALYLAILIVTIVGIVILKVFAKKKVSAEIQTDKNTVKISKEEYALLLEKAKKYDEFVAGQGKK